MDLRNSPEDQNTAIATFISKEEAIAVLASASGYGRRLLHYMGLNDKGVDGLGAEVAHNEDGTLTSPILLRDLGKAARRLQKISYTRLTGKESLQIRPVSPEFAQGLSEEINSFLSDNLPSQSAEEVEEERNTWWIKNLDPIAVVSHNEWYETRSRARTITTKTVRGIFRLGIKSFAVAGTLLASDLVYGFFTHYVAKPTNMEEAIEIVTENIAAGFVVGGFAALGIAIIGAAVYSGVDTIKYTGYLKGKRAAFEALDRDGIELARIRESLIEQRKASQLSDHSTISTAETIPPNS